MELLQALPSLNLQQLLAVCQRDQIPVITHISEALLRACIEKRILELCQVSPIVFDAGPLAENLALEAKIGDQFVGKRDSQDWLVSKGVPIEYLTEKGWLEAAAALIYEHKFPIPPVYYNHGLDNIYGMSPKNIVLSFRTYNDLTPEEYLHMRQAGNSDIRILLYQTLPNLLAFARSLPPRGMYFETKAGVINYLYKYPNLERLVDFFSKINENSYPGRRSLVNQYFRAGRKQKFLFISMDSDQNILLAYPPLWFEEEYIRIVLRIPTPGPKTELVSSFMIRGEDPPFYRDQSTLQDAVYVYNRWDPVQDKIVYDPSQKLTPPLNEVIEIVRNNSKDFLRIPFDYLQSLIDWTTFSGKKGVGKDRDRMFYEIRNHFIFS